MAILFSIACFKLGKETKYGPMQQFTLTFCYMYDNNAPFQADRPPRTTNEGCIAE